jgi:hypothetical protein
MSVIVVQGRSLHPTDLEAIQGIIEQNPGWSRWKISRTLCEQWGWFNAAGELKDMSCREMLNHLDRKGMIRLPERRRLPMSRSSRRRVSIEHSTDPITGSLRELGALSVRLIPTKDPDEPLVLHLLEHYHYLGYTYTIGENLRYVVRDERGRLLAIAVWGSAALKVKPRDAWIGWDGQTRMSHLHLVASNTRYLILPWVRVPHLASHLLGHMARRLSADWVARYGHPIHLAETFVEQDRHQGTCYRAANWITVGTTTGRSRRDRRRTVSVPKKIVLVLPLVPLPAMRTALGCCPV